MKYNEKYDRYVDDDLVIYHYDKNKDKLVQCKPFINNKGYLIISTKLGLRLTHRIIWETFVSEIPEGYQIDHINTLKTDNRLENLRLVTPKENQNNTLTRKHMSEAQKGSCNNRGKIRSDFGIKFKEHFGITLLDDPKLYRKERIWYKRHNNKCRWE